MLEAAAFGGDHQASIDRSASSQWLGPLADRFRVLLRCRRRPDRRRHDDPVAPMRLGPSSSPKKSNEGRASSSPDEAIFAGMRAMRGPMPTALGSHLDPRPESFPMGSSLGIDFVATKRPHPKFMRQAHIRVVGSLRIMNMFFAGQFKRGGHMMQRSCPLGDLFSPK